MTKGHSKSKNIVQWNHYKFSNVTIRKYISSHSFTHSMVPARIEFKFNKKSLYIFISAINHAERSVL